MTARDQKTLLVGGVVVLLIVGYFSLWEPFWRQHQQRAARLEQQRQTLAWMQAAATEIQRLRTAQPTTAKPAPLLSVINQSLRTGPLAQAEKRIEPKGESKVHILFNQIAFDDLVQWLANLPLQPETLSLEKRPQPGLVKARLTLARE